MKTSKQIRQSFFDFFKSKEHLIVPSASMVLKNDSTLMFTNAGMNQFKDIFLVNGEAQHPRIANTQKCLRVSGKHNDLEEVGYDSYHHTMFEMLGNWSFGNYFKEEAIEWAFEYITEVCGISKDILYVTYLEGDLSEQLEPDYECKKIWEKFLPADRILPGSKKDNFWEMGDSGPCGPCSEIHIDLRNVHEKQKIAGTQLVNKDNEDVIELWNLVFIQFNRDMSGKLHQLKSKYVDTGLGFERLCRVIQGKKSNYDTDIFIPLIKEIENISNQKYGQDNKKDIAFRVIADHIRAVSFAIADGQIPSNIKAGYVIRRILRRAIRYGYTFLGFGEPELYKLVDVLINTTGDAFPELEKQKSILSKVIFEEEQSFLRTLEIGIQKFENYISKNKNKKNINTDFVFELYDTYGFPIDLTQLMAKEKNYTINIENFNKLLGKQKERSRKDATVEMHDWTIIEDNADTEFVGYNSLIADVEIVRYRQINKKGKILYYMVFDKTPFYAESGGQIGDTGVIISKDEKIILINTLKELDMTIHIAETLPKNIHTTFSAQVDKDNRIGIMRNHTATHLLHFALRSILGAHVEQKGSLVAGDHLRFDFSHFSKLTDDEIESIEKTVNALIRDNIALTEHILSCDEARAKGAIALFGEKYEDKVRVIQFNNSIELCGGTHVSGTGELGFFKIITETAIAAGIRRIEAVTGSDAETLILAQWKILSQIESAFNNPKNIINAIKNLKEKNRDLEKKIEEIENQQVQAIAKSLISEVTDMNGIMFLSKTVDISNTLVKNLAFEMKKLSKCSFFYVFGNINEPKAYLTVIISDDLVKEKVLHAGDIVKELAKEINGGGGGQPNLAVAGGENIQGLSKALEKARKYLE